jgi:hypothetical protein
MRIIVNGKAHEIAKTTVSYDDLVQLAFPNAPKDKVLTMTFRRGSNSGSLLRGDYLTVRDGMVINVADTSKA